MKLILAPGRSNVSGVRPNQCLKASPHALLRLKALM